jgi:hypothetical protein
VRSIIFILASFAFVVSLCMADPPAKHPKTGEPLVIECLKGTPKAIDGKLDDWPLKSMTPAVLDTKEQIFPGVAPGAAGWNGPNDSSGKFYLMWDDKYVYIGAIMKDDKIVTTKAGGSIWQTDCIEIFFSTTNAVPGHSEHYQYGFTPKDQKWNWCNMDGMGQREPDYMKIASTITADGYICEAAIEYKQIKSLKWEAGQTLGFHPVFDDADNGMRKLQMTWTGREAHDQSQGFGHMILSDKSAAVYSGDKMAITWGEIKR